MGLRHGIREPSQISSGCFVAVEKISVFLSFLAHALTYVGNAF
jgi:hypothetical protein